MPMQEVDFYVHNEPAFKATVVKQVNIGEIFYIDKTTIQPLTLHCSIDYFSEEYQVNIMKRCFNKVKDMQIWEILSGERVAKLPQQIDIKFDNPKLNEEQKKAIEGALGAPEMFLIWGPPGTGKTEVIKEIAKQETLRGNKTLITSQANLAVDNALARLHETDSAYSFRIAKDGYELEGTDKAKVPFQNTSPRFYLDFLENQVKAAEENTFNKYFLRDIEKAKKSIDKKNKSDAEIREFGQFAELYRKKINVVGATLMECGKNYQKTNKLLNTVGIEKFDTVIIDEVSKATPPELFIPIPLGKKLILVGDHKQLPPVFKMLSGDDKPLEQWAEDVGIDKFELDVENTIFERLWNRHINEASAARSLLTQQYRMHPDIQKLIEPFYEDSEGTLKCGLLPEDIDKLKIEHSFFSTPTIWIGTQNSSKEKQQGTSFYNDDEIEKTGVLLKKLANLNDKNLSVGVITFYGAQLRELRNQYRQQYESKFGEGKLIFGTVDRFQGRECDVIICSLVRNNKHRNIGFASKVNRINVAFSRARKVLIILGCKEQFAYELKNKQAQKKYKYIYDNCHKPKPKELTE